MQTVSVKSSVKRDVSNEDLLAQFERAVQGRLAPAVIAKYVSAARDAFNYFRTRDTAPLPVSRRPSRTACGWRVVTWSACGAVPARLRQSLGWQTSPEVALESLFRPPQGAPTRVGLAIRPTPWRL